jgi:uncharacterized membrane-anchored protein YhcB (DUF1043 family)
LVESQLVWLAALGGIGIGIFLGAVAGRAGTRRESKRVRALEEQLAQAESEHASYRTQVSEHFVETSRRLHDLTLQYKSVYEHLADGARALCPEGAVAIAPSLAEAALPETASKPPVEREDAQLDLELDAPGRWAADHDDGLGPILDEETPAPPAAEPEGASLARGLRGGEAAPALAPSPRD